ncbi:MAG TPA: ABC transporter substrate-binding protein [Devosia sp.]|nr:ABC transporter substrate-binding protein [Devosia sp.]
MNWRFGKMARAGLAALALAAATTALTPALAEATTLQMAWSQDATGLDPHKQTAFSSIRLLELIYEPLVRSDASLNTIPAIAKSWTFSPDGKTLTFQLDPNAKFSDGTPVTPADVKASFNRVLDEKTSAASRANFLSIASIDTPDDHTVTFNLSQPDVPILSAMTSINAAIVPASAIANNTLGTKAVGSGPFELKEWQPNAKEVLVANPNWAGGKTGVDEIDVSVLPDETAILAAMRAGKIDFALMNDPLVATLVDKEPKLQLNREPGLNYHVLQLNPSRKPMDNLLVRQAISCAVDRQAVLDTSSLGEGKVTGPLTIPAFASDPSTLFCYKQDVAKAKDLMKQAGLENGFSATVIAATGEPPTAASDAQVLQSQLAAIGIKLNIQMMELNVYVDRWLKGDFDMAVAENGGRSDPYTMYVRYWTKTGNLLKVSNYVDDTLDSLMQQGRAETDPAKRKVIFQQFEKHLAEMSPWIWLYAANNYTAQQKYVKGFVPTPAGSLFGLSKVTVEK